VIKLCPDDEVTLGLGLVEGIETGLRLIGIGWRPIWAAGSAANIAKFPTFAGIDELTIFADRDGNEVGQRAARECARRWSEAGRPVAVRAPSRIGADWGDV
jgi:putative DNA primase/helicase